MDKINIEPIGEQKLKNDMYKVVLKYLRCSCELSGTYEAAREAAEMGDREKMKMELRNLKNHHLMMEKACYIGSLRDICRRVISRLPEYKEYRKNKT